MAGIGGNDTPNFFHTTDNDAAYWLTEARKQQQAGNYHEALKAYYRMIYNYPQDAQIYKDMGNVLSELQQYEEALFRFEQALHFDPTDPDIRQKKAILLDLLGRIDAPEEELAKWDDTSASPGWVRMNTPLAEEICERIAGVSLPVENQVIIVDADIMYRIDLATPEVVQDNESYAEGDEGLEARYDRKMHMVTYTGKQFPILGVNGMFPLLTSPYEERLVEFTRYTNIVSQPLKIIQTFWVQAKNGERLFEFQFDDFSGDWVRVSFSYDANHIIVAAPYDFYIFERRVSAP